MSRLALAGIWLVIMVLLPVAMLRFAWAILARPDKAWAISRAYDRTGNVSANGRELETISRRANRARLEGRRWGCLLCGLLSQYFEKDHCQRSADT